MITLWLGAALAAPPGWEVTNEAFDGCELSKRSEPDAVSAMRAECEWKDVSIDQFDAQLTDWAHHDEIFSAVVDSEVRETAGNRQLVYQKHRYSGINDREVLFWGIHQKVGKADRYAWTIAEDRPFTPAEGNVATKRHDGYWQAEPLEGGGIRVVHELHYDPGGSVPDVLVRAFQSDGLEKNLTELHAALRGKPVG